MIKTSPSLFLKSLFDRAVEVADPMHMLAQHLPPKPKGRVVVVGAGKASARMAEAVEAMWGPCEGLVITRYGYGRPCKGIEIVEAGHPIPDQAGVKATKRMINLVEGLGQDDFVLALISGGASALLVAPAGDITLSEKQELNAELLASGAPISEINRLRKHLSRVKGGQLALAAHPAQMLSLVISDVPGDDLAYIGSGPTAGDASSPEDACAILQKWGIEPTATIANVLAGGAYVVHPDDPILSRVETRIVAAPSQSLTAAAALAQDAGVHVRFLGDAIEGEARDVAQKQANLALTIQAERGSNSSPILLLSGGELTVTRRGQGIGGPNAEFCLALAIALEGAPGIHAIACDTDGVDGAAEVAGALIGPDTLSRAEALGVDAKKALSTNDAHSFFGTVGGQIVTGPTLTNVNDFRAILIQ